MITVDDLINSLAFLRLNHHESIVKTEILNWFWLSFFNFLAAFTSLASFFGKAAETLGSFVNLRSHSLVPFDNSFKIELVNFSTALKKLYTTSRRRVTTLSSSGIIFALELQIKCSQKVNFWQNNSVFEFFLLELIRKILKRQQRGLIILWAHTEFSSHW